MANHWLIPFRKTNTNLQSDSDDGGNKQGWFSINTHSRLVIELVLLFFVLVFPAAAHAGVFSFLGAIFADTQTVINQTLDTTQNSQNMALLRAAVNPNPDPAKGGGDITIVGDMALLSEAGPSGTIADIDEYKQSSGQISLYVVREGDTLSQIATMFGVSVNTIMWANGTERASLIAPGETLIILPVSGIRHTVKSGETLAGIVKKYKGHFEEVLEYNGLKANAKLAVGDVVVIPDGEIAAPKITTSSVARGTSGPSYDGYYMRPVSGGTKTQGIHGYNAIDIGAPFGTPILASASGTVIISRDWGWNGGYGNYVVIKHNNGTQTLYAHNSRNIVSSGQSVVQGQVIGYVGSTGKSTGNHLHFEIRGAKNPF